MSQITFALLGKSGAGKTTVADYLHNYYGVGCIAFADPLKEAAEILFNGESFYYCKNRSIRDSVVTKRKFICDLADMVKAIDEDSFIKIADRQTRKMKDFSAVVFTDVRFKNEVKYLRGKKAVFIEIVRDDLEPVGFEHESEQLDTSKIHRIVIKNNGTISDLYSEVDRAMLHYLEYLS